VKELKTNGETEQERGYHETLTRITKNVTGGELVLAKEQLTWLREQGWATLKMVGIQTLVEVLWREK